MAKVKGLGHAFLDGSSLIFIRQLLPLLTMFSLEFSFHLSFTLFLERILVLFHEDVVTSLHSRSFALVLLGSLLLCLLLGRLLGSVVFRLIIRVHGSLTLLLGCRLLSRSLLGSRLLLRSLGSRLIVRGLFVILRVRLWFGSFLRLLSRSLLGCRLLLCSLGSRRVFRVTLRLLRVRRLGIALYISTRLGGASLGSLKLLRRGFRVFLNHSSLLTPSSLGSSLDLHGFAGRRVFDSDLIGGREFLAGFGEFLSTLGSLGHLGNESGES